MGNCYRNHLTKFEIHHMPKSTLRAIRYGSSDNPLSKKALLLKFYESLAKKLRVFYLNFAKLLITFNQNNFNFTLNISDRLCDLHPLILKPFFCCGN